MACYVCNGTAQVWDRNMGGKSVDCPGCGRYDISASAFADMNQNIRIFIVDMTRNWLKEQRAAGENPPLIERHTAFWD
jgi:hypothetical protein